MHLFKSSRQNTGGVAGITAAPLRSISKNVQLLYFFFLKSINTARDYKFNYHFPKDAALDKSLQHIVFHLWNIFPQEVKKLYTVTVMFHS